MPLFHQNNAMKPILSTQCAVGLDHPMITSKMQLYMCIQISHFIINNHYSETADIYLLTTKYLIKYM